MIQDRLREMQRQCENIDDGPRTALEILGETGRERYWERYLSYFLDPTTPHDFGADLLNALLGAARPTAEVSIPTPVEPKNVRVTTQAQTATGPADILVYDPPSWFLCIELKIHASETNRQTARYANASRIGDIETERYDRGEYVYLAPVSSGPPASERFTTLSWQTLVPYFESVLDSETEYSERSRVQLSDFITTVRRELPMDDFTEFSDETRLYAEYADTIHSLTDAHEKDWRALYNNLVRTFYDDFDPTREQWESKITNSLSYSQFYKPRWHSLDNGVNMEYEPHIDLESKPADIRLRFDVEGGEKDAVRDAILDRTGMSELEARDWEPVDGTYEFVGKSIPLSFDDPTAATTAAVDELSTLHRLIGPAIEEVASEF